MNNGIQQPRPPKDQAIDGIDRRILIELLADARVSIAELSRRVSLSPPAVAERMQRLERSGVVTGYHAAVDPRALGYSLTAIVRVKPAARQLHKIPELAEGIPEISECLRITGDDCFIMKVHLRSIEDLSGLLDRFLVFGETTTSLVAAAPIPLRDPPF
jgi:Lrp/AsnC family leucine-responsive transcriptional regulator